MSNTPCSLPDASAFGRDAFSPLPRLIVTDVDSTLIAQEVIEELAHFAGTRGQVADITARAMNGEIDFAESLRLRVSTLAGVPATVFDEVLHSITPTPGVRDLIDAVHAHGGFFGVVSGGFEEVVAPLCHQLNIDHYLANRLEIANGFLTGKVLGAIVTADAKVQALEEWRLLHGLDINQTVAIGDGANDIPMLQRAGVGIAFCAKPTVREQVKYSLNVAQLDLLIEPLGLSGVPRT